jgi:predicted regulator of Ras-like GTPase activity (Roadblock/LC7/MglB family)/transposase-like protein
MYILREWIGVVPTEQQERHIVSALTSQYIPFFRSGVSALLKIISTTNEENFLPPYGEVFLSKQEGKQIVFYYLKFPTGIEVGSLSLSDVQNEHHAFVQTFVSSLGESAARRILSSSNKVFSALNQEWGAFPVSDEDRTSVEILLDPTARKFLRETIKSGRIPLGEAEEKSLKSAVEALEKAKIIKSQYSIFCRQTGNQIMMVDSTEAIQEATRQGFKCFVCGRSFSEERLTQFVSPTPYGQKISKANYWLVVQAYQILQEFFSPQRIVVIHEGDVSTLFLNVESSLLLVEIKESPYWLRDAYLFSKKVELYKPSASFLLLISPLEGDVSLYFSNALQKHPFWIGNSFEALKEKLPVLLKFAYKDCVQEIFDRFTEVSFLPIQTFLMSYLFPQEGLLFKKPEKEETANLPLPPGVEEAPIRVETPAYPPPQPKDEILEILPTEILEFEKPTFSASTSPSKKEIIGKIIEEVQAGVAGKESSLHILLQDLSDSDRRCKACLISQDGLVVASTLESELAEVLASYGSESFSLVQNLIREHGLSPLESLGVAWPNASVELQAAGGVYLVITATLETVVVDPLPIESLPETLKSICDRLMAKRGIRSVAVITQDGLVLSERSNDDSQSSTLFPVFLELFPKLSSHFESMERGNLQGMAVRTPSQNIALAQAGTAYIGVTFENTEFYEDFAPFLLAIASEASRLFSPAEV